MRAAFGSPSDIQAVCPAPFQFFYWPEAGYGAELARSVNEGIAKIVADTPDRFVGMGEENALGLIAQVKKLSAADRALIQGGNAARLLKIKPN